MQGIRSSRYWVALIAAVVGCGGDATTATPTVESPAGVASVEVVASTATTISVGQTLTLAATPRDAAGRSLAGRAVTWLSSAPNVASVSSSGVVTALAVGNATISATSEGRSGTVTVTVTPIPVSSVVVSPATASLVQGASRTFTAVARDNAGSALTDRSITWATANAAVATISPSGVVVAVAPGTTTVTATADGVVGTATVEVTPIPVATVAVTPASPSLEEGQTTALTAVARDSAGRVLTGRTVVWATDNAAIASVTTSGALTAVSAGTTTISATVEGVRASVPVVVTPAATAVVELAETFITMTRARTTTVTGVARSAAGTVLANRPLTWTSSNARVATVTSAGVISAVAGGVTTVTATREGKSASLQVAVVGNDDDMSWAINAGGAHSCGLLADGRALCWGWGGDAMGTGPQSPVAQPTLVLGGGVFDRIGTGDFPEAIRTCALGTTGAAFCWGTSGVGDGTGSFGATRPTAVAGGRTFRSLAVGDGHSCGVATDGDTYCWGTTGSLGELGNGPDGSANGTPVKALTPEPLVSVTAGARYSCGLTNTGVAYCWGHNFEGYLGTGSFAGERVPTKVATNVRFAALAAGSATTCGIALEGDVYCWGYVSGQEPTNTSATPVLQPGGRKFTAITIGWNHRCGLTRDGNAWCWGDNRGGAAGWGTAGGASAEPRLVAGNRRFVAISAGYYHTCAVDQAGAAFCWGAGASGRIGDGSLSDRFEPRAVLGGYMFGRQRP